MSVFGGWIDVHGAGAQRSDAKTGNPANFPTGFGPQGDAIRIYNYVRLVRNISTTGVENTKTNKKMLSIYPNPVKDICNISLNQYYKKIKIDVYNILGNKVKALNIENSNLLNINLIDLPKDIYIVNLTLDGNLFSKRIVRS